MRNNDSMSRAQQPKAEDDLERWQRTRVVIEKVDVDASMPELNVPSLTLRSSRIPNGELAKLQQVESLVIIGSSAEQIDVRGCSGLRHLSVGNVRGLREVVGLEELTGLEELELYALPRLESVPALDRHTKLWRLDLGSMKGMKDGLAPFVAAPQLRELQLQSTFPLAPGDAELVRDHPRLVGLSWFDAKGTPSAEIRHLFEIADRRSARLRKDGKPSEHEVPQNRLQDIAPEHMVQISLTVKGSASPPRSLSGIGDALLEGEHDFGPGLRQIRITLNTGEPKPSSTKVNIQQAKGVMTCEHPSDVAAVLLEEQPVSRADFTQIATEMIAALEESQGRVTEQISGFDIDALIRRCRSVSEQISAGSDDVEELIAQAEDRARAMRVAMNRLQQTAGKGGSRTR